MSCLLFVEAKKKKLFDKTKNIPSSVILFLMIFVLFLPQTYAIISNISIVLLTALLIFNIKENSAVYKFLTRKKNSIFRKNILFSLYLWHWGILSISYLTIGGVFLWSLPIQLILVLVISHLSFKFIEQHLER